MSPTNLLVLIHGITVDPLPRTHQEDYNAMLHGIYHLAPALQTAFAKTVFVEWGHRPPNTPAKDLRGDQRIMDAENALHARVGYQAVSADHSPQNHVLNPTSDPLALVVRTATDPIKEKLDMYGFTDAFYYMAPEGEAQVRAAVYHAVLQALAEYKHAPDVRLHLIGHSLGVTVSHDFLFGLFAPDDQLTGGVPGFLGNYAATKDDKANYAFWRGQAGKNLTVGSFTSTAGQLPLVMMRKQALVDRLAQGQSLDASVIGITGGDKVKWRSYYDVVDVLGFPSRRLYNPTPAIEEFEVDNGFNPVQVHSLYWTNKTVLQQTADLLTRNVS